VFETRDVGFRVPEVLEHAARAALDDVDPLTVVTVLAQQHAAPGGNTNITFTLHKTHNVVC